MKYLKTFEAKGTHIITKVDFTGGGDGVHAIYIGGNLHKYGDYYHDKIEEWMEGFVGGLEWCGLEIRVDKVECIDEEMISDVSEMSNIPPKNLSAIKYK